MSLQLCHLLRECGNKLLPLVGEGGDNDMFEVLDSIGGKHGLCEGTDGDF